MVETLDGHHLGTGYFMLSLIVATIEAGKAVIIILFIANTLLAPQGHFSC